MIALEIRPDQGHFVVPVGSGELHPLDTSHFVAASQVVAIAVMEGHETGSPLVDQNATYTSVGFSNGLVYLLLGRHVRQFFDVVGEI